MAGMNAGMILSLSALVTFTRNYGFKIGWSITGGTTIAFAVLSFFMVKEPLDKNRKDDYDDEEGENFFAEVSRLTRLFFRAVCANKQLLFGYWI